MSPAYLPSAQIPGFVGLCWQRCVTYDDEFWWWQVLLAVTPYLPIWVLLFKYGLLYLACARIVLIPHTDTTHLFCCDGLDPMLCAVNRAAFGFFPVFKMDHVQPQTKRTRDAFRLDAVSFRIPDGSGPGP